jgi:hypothetical protein
MGIDRIPTLCWPLGKRVRWSNVIVAQLNILTARGYGAWLRHHGCVTMVASQCYGCGAGSRTVGGSQQKSDKSALCACKRRACG